MRVWIYVSVRVGAVGDFVGWGGKCVCVCLCVCMCVCSFDNFRSVSAQVDCFSFGMFVFELLVLKLPFEDGETRVAGVPNLNSHILGGARPHLSPNVSCLSLSISALPPPV